MPLPTGRSRPGGAEDELPHIPILKSKGVAACSFWHSLIFRIEKCLFSTEAIFSTTIG